MKKFTDPRQMFLDFRVKLEPALEPLTCGKTLDELEDLLATYLRFARQIQTKVGAMRLDLGLPPIPRRERAVSFPLRSGHRRN
jgi:hypothetical protein